MKKLRFILTWILLIGVEYAGAQPFKVNIGSSPNNEDGDPPQTAYLKIQSNVVWLAAQSGGGGGSSVSLSSGLNRLNTVSNIWVFDGDSLTDFYGLGGYALAYPALCATNDFFSGRFVITNVALHGQYLEDITNGLASNVLARKPSGATNGYYSLLIGANDIIGGALTTNTMETWFQKLTNIYYYARTNNYKVVAMTITPYSTDSGEFGIVRRYVNKRLREERSSYDVLIDTARMFPNPLDLKFYAGDALHLNTNAQAVVAGYISATMTAGKDLPLPLEPVPEFYTEWSVKPENLRENFELGGYSMKVSKGWVAIGNTLRGASGDSTLTVVSTNGFRPLISLSDVANPTLKQALNIGIETVGGQIAVGTAAGDNVIGAQAGGRLVLATATGGNNAAMRAFLTTAGEFQVNTNLFAGIGYSTIGPTGRGGEASLTVVSTNGGRAVIGLSDIANPTLKQSMNFGIETVGGNVATGTIAGDNVIDAKGGGRLVFGTSTSSSINPIARGGVTTSGAFFYIGSAVGPTITGDDGAHWNSNKVLYWVTATKTNLISDGR